MNDDPRLRLRVKRPHDALLWRAGQQHAVRLGDWKLVRTRVQPPLIINLKDDIGEQRDLAASHPDKLTALRAAFADWEKGTQPAMWVRQDQRNAEPGGKLKSGAGSTLKPEPFEGRAQVPNLAGFNGEGLLDSFITRHSPMWLHQTSNDLGLESTLRPCGQLDAHFGLGEATSADVTITLLNGKSETFSTLIADQVQKLTLRTP